MLYIVGCHFNTYNVTKGINYAKLWYNSIVNQDIDCDKFKIVAINDCSNDNTKDYLISVGEENKNLIVLNNKDRKGYSFNLTVTLFKNISFKDEDIIVIVDGDDQLAIGSLSYLIDIYRDSEIWLTYGSYSRTNGGGCHCQPLDKDVKIRKKPIFFMSHLRTYKWFLAKNMPISYVQCNNSFIPCSADRAIMCSLYEMAGYDHTVFINRNMYVYNTENPLSLFRDRPTIYPPIIKSIMEKKELTIKTKKDLINGICDWDIK